MLFLLNPFFCNAQTTIIGQVLDTNEVKFRVNAVFKIDTGTFIYYSCTNQLGNYKLETLKKGSDDVDTKGVHGDCSLKLACS